MYTDTLYVVVFVMFNDLKWEVIVIFNATFNNILVISWRRVLLVEETGEKHRPVASHWQTLPYNVVSSTTRQEQGLNSQL